MFIQGVLYESNAGYMQPAFIPSGASTLGVFLCLGLRA